jgi:phosphopantetheine adenylyltransferase
MEGCVIQKEGHTKAFFVFGRFQPPTIGHAVIIDAISQLASEEDADGYVFVSSSKDSKKNPLSVEQKIQTLLKQHAGKYVTFVDTTLCNCKGIFPVINALKRAGYTDLTFIVGSDRVDEFKKTLENYHPDIVVASVGDTRDSDESNDPSSVSGTRLRELAKRKNLKEFSKFVKVGSMTNENVTTLMENVQAGMKGGNRTRRRSKQRSRRNLKTRR